MTEVQAAEVIHIVLMDQRAGVLREVLKLVDDERREVHRTEDDGRDASIKLELLNGIELKIEVLMKRG